MADRFMHWQMLRMYILDMSLKITNLRLQVHLLGGNGLSVLLVCYTPQIGNYAPIMFMLQYARPPNKRPPEQLILDRRNQEDMRRQAEELTKYNKLCDLKNDWERSTDKRIQLNTVRRRVKGLLQSNQFAVEDRRERSAIRFE